MIARKLATKWLWRMWLLQALAGAAILLWTGATPLQWIVGFAAFCAVSVFAGATALAPLARFLATLHASAAEAATGPPEDLDSIERSIRTMKSDLQKNHEASARERDELATVMGSISDAILAVDWTGVPLFFNSRFLMLFAGPDFAARRPRLGEVFRDPEILGAFHSCLNGGEATQREVRLHGRDGSGEREFALSVSPLSKRGSAYGAVGVFHDVTELKRAERIRIEFVANVSHELRSPLTSIKGYADTLAGDIESKRYDDLPRFIEVIRRNSERLMALIGDLLDLSAIEAAENSGAPFRREALSTHELTERALAQIRSRADEKHQQLRSVYEAEVVFGDPLRIEQVLVNLLSNACKYVQPGGQIEVRWESHDDDCLLHVKDNGPGIAPEHQARLFERFYRIDRGRSRDEGGTGLGLAIVKHIMQIHLGAVWVMSAPGRGTEFICRFPGRPPAEKATG